MESDDARCVKGNKRLESYLVSPTNKVHWSRDGETPTCGQVIYGEWSYIHEPMHIEPEDVAQKYHHLSFCQKCYRDSWYLNRVAWRARKDA